MHNVPLISAGILAVGALLDFITAESRPAIYEKFYRWWTKLSQLDLESAGERGVRRFILFFDGLFGPHVFSFRSFGTGAAFIIVISSVFSLFRLRDSDMGGQERVVHALVYSSMTLIPGLVSFQGGRVLIGGLRRRVTFFRLLVFGAASLLLIGVVVYLSYLIFGVCTALAVRLAFNHHLAVVDLVPVMGVLMLTALGVITIYLPVAILPALCCVMAWLAFILLYLSSRLGLWTKHFLKDRIEQEWRAPLTHVAGVVVGFLWVGSMVVLTVDVAAVKRFSTYTKEKIMLASAGHGSRLGVRLGILSAPDRNDVASYYMDWAAQSLAFMQPFMQKGMPTPEEVGELLENHLPKLGQQWEAENRLRVKVGNEPSATPSRP